MTRQLTALQPIFEIQTPGRRYSEKRYNYRAARAAFENNDREISVIIGLDLGRFEPECSLWLSSKRDP